LKRIILLAVAAMAAPVALSAAATTATAAVTSASAPEHAARARVTRDTVLVNQPASKVCVGKKFTVGVWYQQFSGGSRAYRVHVYSPRWRLIFHRHGRASATAWKLWHIRAGQPGKYHTTYTVKNSSGQWYKYPVVTRSRRC
jgi:hypothetical protein